MLSPSQSLQYQKESVERALTCANCGQKLHVLEVHMCEHCCAELMSDPNNQGENYAVMDPWSAQRLADAQTVLHASDQLVRTAWENAQIPTNFGGIRALMSNGLASRTQGAFGGTLTVKTQPTVTYNAVKDSYQFTVTLTGATASVTGFLKAGDQVKFTNTYWLQQQTKQALYNGATPISFTATVNDVSRMAKSGAGRQSIASQAANVSEDVAKAAESAGIDINALTPGMRSGSRGIAQAEGALASTPGIVQDAHQAAFNEISSKLSRNLDEFGAASGTASEKSAAIKQRILQNLDQMKDAERAAWDDVRSTMPNQKARMLNGNAVIQAERSAGIPLTPEMKQFVQANNQGGVTFDGMKAWRAKFADAEQKYKRSGEANAARRAGEIRRAITDDMRTMAENGGFFDDWQKANDLSKARLSAQESAESVFGRDLATDALITNGVKSLQSSSAKGLNGPAGFHSMIRALPESERVPAISSMLQDAISHGVRGGKSDAAGINHIAEILTPQNVKAISRYSSELGRIADAYGTLARAAVKPQQYIERTGRTANVLRDLDAGLSNVTSTVLNAIANSTSGAIVGGAGGGIAGAAAGALVGAGLKGAVSKIATTRSGRYAIEKAVQEATKAVRAGGSKEALAAAERRFMANKAAVKAIRDALGNEEFQRLSRAGIVASLSGMTQE